MYLFSLILFIVVILINANYVKNVIFSVFFINPNGFIELEFILLLNFNEELHVNFL